MKGIQQAVVQVVGGLNTLMALAGFASGGLLLWFHVNLLHNFIHLVMGLVGLWAGFAQKGKYAQDYNLWLGATYLMIVVLSVIAPQAMMNLLAINQADNVLHLTMGVVLAAVGFYGVEKR